MTTPQDILTFWFEDLEPKDWWVGGAAIDQSISQRFGDTVEQALRGELYDWRATAEGRLAEIICLDQFTRNICRGTAKAFAGDPMALVLCQEAMAGGHDLALTKSQRSFLYMPLMHSESLAIHRLAAEKFEALNPGEDHTFLNDHTDVIAQFGRYPSRNAALGRTSTPEELAYLKDGKTWGQG